MLGRGDTCHPFSMAQVSLFHLQKCMRLGTGGQVWNVSDPSLPDISIGTGTRARAEGPRVGYLIQVSPRSLLPLLSHYNRAQNPKWLEHWGAPRQSTCWTKSSRSGMKPLPSERQLLVEVGVGRWVAHPQDSVLLEEGRGESGIPGRKAT